MPPDEAGGRVTDRGRSDEARAFDDVKHQQCLAHLRRARHEVLQTKKGRARDFGARRKALWQEAIQRWHGYHTGEVADGGTPAQALQDTMPPHLRNRCLTAPDHPRLRNPIGRHHDRGHLLRVLEAPHLAPTNNRAERAGARR